MEAVKHDAGKPRLGLFPTQAILAGGRALTYGVDKYEDFNYKKGKGLDWNQYYDALLRHLFAWIGGEENDKESGLRHTDHVMACCAMLADAVESNIGKDNRFNASKKVYGEWLTTPLMLVQEEQDRRKEGAAGLEECGEDAECNRICHGDCRCKL